MQLARVTGTVVSSVKEPRLTGTKLLLVTETGPDGAAGGGAAHVAVDLVGAGEGELVLVVRGSPAARAMEADGAPVDAAIVGIVDAVRQAGRVTYQKD
jgi:ethanolamine utilization protein EutN